MWFIGRRADKPRRQAHAEQSSRNLPKESQKRNKRRHHHLSLLFHFVVVQYSSMIDSNLKELYCSCLFLTKTMKFRTLKMDYYTEARHMLQEERKETTKIRIVARTPNYDTDKENDETNEDAGSSCEEDKKREKEEHTEQIGSQHTGSVDAESSLSENRIRGLNDENTDQEDSARDSSAEISFDYGDEISICNHDHSTLDEENIHKMNGPETSKGKDSSSPKTSPSSFSTTSTSSSHSRQSKRLLDDPVLAKTEKRTKVAHPLYLKQSLDGATRNRPIPSMISSFFNISWHLSLILNIQRAATRKRLATTPFEFSIHRMPDTTSKMPDSFSFWWPQETESHVFGLLLRLRHRDRLLSKPAKNLNFPIEISQTWINVLETGETRHKKLKRDQMALVRYICRGQEEINVNPKVLQKAWQAIAAITLVSVAAQKWMDICTFAAARPKEAGKKRRFPEAAVTKAGRDSYIAAQNASRPKISTSPEEHFSQAYKKKQRVLSKVGTVAERDDCLGSETEWKFAPDRCSVVGQLEGTVAVMENYHTPAPDDRTPSKDSLDMSGPLRNNQDTFEIKTPKKKRRKQTLAKIPESITLRSIPTSESPSLQADGKHSVRLQQAISEEKEIAALERLGLQPNSSSLTKLECRDLEPIAIRSKKRTPCQSAQSNPTQPTSNSCSTEFDASHVPKSLARRSVQPEKASSPMAANCFNQNRESTRKKEISLLEKFGLKVSNSSPTEQCTNPICKETVTPSDPPTEKKQPFNGGVQIRPSKQNRPSSINVASPTTQMFLYSTKDLESEPAEESTYPRLLSSLPVYGDTDLVAKATLKQPPMKLGELETDASQEFHEAQQSNQLLGDSNRYEFDKPSVYGDLASSSRAKVPTSTTYGSNRRRESDQLNKVSRDAHNGAFSEPRVYRKTASSSYAEVPTPANDSPQRLKQQRPLRSVSSDDKLFISPSAPPLRCRTRSTSDKQSKKQGPKRSNEYQQGLASCRADSEGKAAEQADVEHSEQKWSHSPSRNHKKATETAENKMRSPMESFDAKLQTSPSCYVPHQQRPATLVNPTIQQELAREGYGMDVPDGRETSIQYGETQIPSRSDHRTPAPNSRRSLPVVTLDRHAQDVVASRRQKKEWTSFDVTSSKTNSDEVVYEASQRTSDTGTKTIKEQTSLQPNIKEGKTKKRNKEEGKELKRERKRLRKEEKRQMKRERKRLRSERRKQERTTRQPEPSQVEPSGDPQIEENHQESEFGKLPPQAAFPRGEPETSETGDLNDAVAESRAFNTRESNTEGEVESGPIARLLCSEEFIETWGEVVAKLASGDWESSPVDFVLGAGVENVSNPPSQKIQFLDDWLVDFAGVDIELGGRAAIIVSATSSWETDLGSKPLLKRVIDLALKSRYNFLEIFVCVDTPYDGGIVNEISRLQNGILRQNACPPTTISLGVTSPASLPRCIGHSVLASGCKFSKASEDAEDVIRDRRVQERIRFLLSIVPSLSLGGALKSMQIFKSHENEKGDADDPSRLWFRKIVGKRDQERRRQHQLASSRKDIQQALNPDAMIQLSFVVNLSLHPQNYPL